MSGNELGITKSWRNMAAANRTKGIEYALRVDAIDELAAPPEETLTIDDRYGRREEAFFRIYLSQVLWTYDTNYDQMRPHHCRGRERFFFPNFIVASKDVTRSPVSKLDYIESTGFVFIPVAGANEGNGVASNMERKMFSNNSLLPFKLSEGNCLNFIIFYQNGNFF